MDREPMEYCLETSLIFSFLPTLHVQNEKFNPFSVLFIENSCLALRKRDPCFHELFIIFDLGIPLAFEFFQQIFNNAFKSFFVGLGIELFKSPKFLLLQYRAAKYVSARCN